MATMDANEIYTHVQKEVQNCEVKLHLICLDTNNFEAKLILH